MDANDSEHHVGYVKKDETDTVRKVMDDNEFYNAVEFTGGKI